MSHHYSHYGAGAKFAGAQGFTKIFIISNNSDYSKQNVAGFKLEAKRLGLQLVGTVVTDQIEKFEALVTKVMAANPDLVYFPSDANQGGVFFREARAAGYMGVFLGTDSMDNPALVEIAGPLLTDGSGMYYTQMVTPASLYPDAIKFIEDFQLNYDAEPQYFGAQAYDAAGICLKAIEEASKAKNGEIPTRTEVANAIRALQDYKGITGTYTFNGKGELTLAKYFVLKVVSVDPNYWNRNTLVTSFDVAPPK